MNLFGRLFKKRVKPMLDDLVFGQIEYEFNHGNGLWCHTPSAPREPMIIIDAPLTGPTPTQRDFYTTQRNNLAGLESECKRFIATQDDPPANLMTMTVYLIEIGSENEIASGSFVIELADKDADEIHRVEFRNGKPEAYGVDD